MIPRHLICWVCNERPIEIHAVWSDREQYICSDDDCRQDVLEYHDEDHDYDQDGVIWEWLNGNREYTARKDQPQDRSTYLRKERYVY